MKKTIILIVAAIMILSFTACSSSAVQEDAAQTTDTIEPGEVSTPEPTLTLEPTPTPVVLTEEEQEYLELFEYLPDNDVFAGLVLIDAYTNCRLDHLVETGKVNEAMLDSLEELYMHICIDLRIIFFEELNVVNVFYEDIIEELKSKNVYYSKASNFVKALNSGITSELNFHLLTLLTINRGNENPIQVSYDFVNGAEYNFERLFGDRNRGAYTFVSAFPEDEKEDLQELLYLIDNITDEGNMDKFHERYQREDLSPIVEFYIASYLYNYPEFYDETGSFKYRPIVMFDGKKIHFDQYIWAYCVYDKAKLDYEKYLAIVYADQKPLEDYEKFPLEYFDIKPIFDEFQ